MQTWLWLSFITLLTAVAAVACTSQACVDLADHYNETQTRWFSYDGVLRSIIMYETSIPAQRALALLLKLILKLLLGYRHVEIQTLPPSEDVLENVANSYRHKTNFAVLPGVHLPNESQKMLFKEVGVVLKRTPLRMRIELSERALADPSCNFSETDWLRFTNFTPGDCDFLLYDSFQFGQLEKWPGKLEWCRAGNFCAGVIVSEAPNVTVEDLVLFLHKYRLRLAPVSYDTRNNTFGNRSQVFLSGYDFDPEYFFMPKALAHYAHHVYLTIINFVNFTMKVDLGAKLTAEGNPTDIENRACKYLLQNKKVIDELLEKENSTVFILYYLCEDDPHKDKIEEAMNRVEKVTQQKVTYTLRLQLETLSCKHGFESAFQTELNKTRSEKWLYTGARVVPKANEWQKSLADRQETLLMLYETQSIASKKFSVFLATVDWDSLMTAAAALLKSLGLKKVTLHIKNRTDEEIERLRRYLGSYHFYVQRFANNTTAQVLLVDADTAVQLACLGSVRQDSPPMLLVLDQWSPRSLLCIDQQPVSLWSISGAWPGGSQAMQTLAKTGADLNLHQVLQNVFGGDWPAQVTSITDAVLLAALAINRLRQQHPEFIHNIHGSNVTSRLLSEIVRNLNINGVTQSLHYYENHTLTEPLVFVTQWENGTNARLEVIMHLLQLSDTPLILWSRDNHYGPNEIITLRHNHSEISFLSLLCYSTFVIVLTASLTVLCCQMRRWLSKRRKLILVSQTLAPAQLAAFELRRDEFEMHEKISEGIVGRVFIALRRGRRKTYVAVKTPMAGSAGGSALLWEARALAPLRHANVIRLLGIVSQGTPPLLILEYALHRDLCHYLEEVEIRAGCWRDVSAVLLTRLAKEAATALAYLTSRDMIHRDVRASNCLVDEHHVLKLADFSMARKLSNVVTEDVGMNHYQCRRRALFPVPWMAPESLKRGIFSPASDMWSYGVLLVELVTLGARPYGAWAPDIVLCHVVNGGMPLLPSDASTDMCELTQQCWTHATNSRMTATQALAFLEQRPSALTPCTSILCLSLPPIMSSPSATLLEGKSDSHLESIDEFKVFRSYSI